MSNPTAGLRRRRRHDHESETAVHLRVRLDLTYQYVREASRTRRSPKAHHTSDVEPRGAGCLPQGKAEETRKQQEEKEKERKGSGVKSSQHLCRCAHSAMDYTTASHTSAE